MGQALYRKWRPQVWDDVVGQEPVTQTLRNAIRASRLAHAYVFAGPRGCGKTTSARLLAKAANCLHEDPARRPCNACAHCTAVNEGRFLDLIEIDGASNNGVDQIRDLRDKVNFSPNEGRFKVYIIDEAHMLSTPAFNALLKTLEEPPAHAIFILATTESHKIPATVLSRCQRHEFRRVSVAEIVARLKVMAAGEGLQVEDDALEVLARQATGSLRDAISLLDQLASGEGPVTLERAQAVLGTAAGQAIQSLVDALAAKDAAQGLALINACVDGGTDPRQFARQTVDYLRGLLLVRMGNAPLVDATQDVRLVMARQASQFSPQELLRGVRVFNSAAADPRAGWQPQLPLELALVELTLAEEAPPSPRPAVPVVKATSGTVSRATEPSAPAAVRGAAPAHSPGKAADNPPERPAAPSNPPAVTSAVEDGSISLAEVTRGWKQILGVMRRIDPQAHGLLNSCKPAGVEGQVVVLATNDFVKQKLDREENRAKVIEAMAEVLGRPCGIKCVLGSGKESDSAAGGDHPEDGMVATALRDLGAEIVDSKKLEK